MIDTFLGLVLLFFVYYKRIELRNKLSADMLALYFYVEEYMVDKLTELPNIGSAIAKDLIAIGILNVQQLKIRRPLAVFNALKNVMGHRHDPCVYYTLLSVEHFNRTGEALKWWEFTEQGKIDLKKNKDLK